MLFLKFFLNFRAFLTITKSPLARSVHKLTSYFIYVLRTIVILCSFSLMPKHSTIVCSLLPSKPTITIITITKFVDRLIARAVDIHSLHLYGIIIKP